MRAIFKLGEKPIRTSSMNLATETGVSAAGFSSGKLILTNERLIFEPDLLSTNASYLEISLADVEQVQTGRANALKFFPILPTLIVATPDGRSYRFAAAPFSNSPEDWQKALEAARAGYQPGVAEEPATRAPTIYCQLPGARIGPMTREEFNHNLSLGRIKADTPTWADAGEWRPASGFSGYAPPSTVEALTPPPAPIDHRIAWAIVAVPVLGSIVQLFIDSSLVYLYLVANALLCVYDARLLKGAGYDTPEDKWSLYVVPIHLWKRAALLKQKPMLAIAWLVAFVASIWIDHAGERASLQATACPLVTQIIQQQLYASASCKGVSLVKEVGDGFYTATATLDNGNDIKITIQRRGKEIYVQIPRQ